MSGPEAQEPQAKQSQKRDPAHRGSIESIEIEIERVFHTALLAESMAMLSGRLWAALAQSRHSGCAQGGKAQAASGKQELARLSQGGTSCVWLVKSQQQRLAR
ncbi:hypothetical protein [Synechococcus sp. R3-13]|uniref:hypothetical protein n=2 Tax=Synechococcus TaxID=1129 RepID=UPI0039C42CF8